MGKRVGGCLPEAAPLATIAGPLHGPESNHAGKERLGPSPESFVYVQQTEPYAAILIEVGALLHAANDPPSLPNCTVIASLGVPKRVPRKP